MSSFDDRQRRNTVGISVLPPNGLPRSWLPTIAAVAILLVGLGYAFSRGWLSTSNVTEHRAAATDVPTPLASPMNPTIAPNASVAPKATPKP
jgi:hypothetical protein